MINRTWLNIALALCLFAGVWHSGSAAWIYGKAHLATFLIEKSWQDTLANHQINKPWSWADTWPIAEIDIPAIHLNEIVLAGDSGASLAFGPGLSNAGANLDGAGVKLISAHRDTHFSALQNIEVGDVISLKAIGGAKQYRVSDIRVVDVRDYVIDASSEEYDLVLATCYPFNAVTAGGFQRYIVQSREES